MTAQGIAQVLNTSLASGVRPVHAELRQSACLRAV
jgi:hypothetical protein